MENVTPPRLPDPSRDVDAGYVAALLNTLRLFFARLTQAVSQITAALGETQADVGTLQTDVGTLQTDVNTLETNTAFTPVHFYAQHTSGETPAVNGTLVNWTVQINAGSGSFSSGVYTVPATGRYRVQAGLLLDNSGGGTPVGGGILVKINSTQQCRIFYGTAAANNYGMGSGEQFFNLTAGDTIALTTQLSVPWFGGAGVDGVGGWTIERMRSA